MSRRTQIVKMIKKLVSLSLLFVCVLPNAFAETEYNPYAPSYTVYDTTYEAILKMYIRVINAYGKKSEGHHDLFNALIYDDIYDEACFNPSNASEAQLKRYRKKLKDTVGYCICDINSDGTTELVIGMGKDHVFEVFTIQEDRVRELMHTGYRCRGYVLDSGLLFEDGHSGAGMCSKNTYSFGEKEPRQFYDGYYENDFYTYDGSPMGEWHGETWFKSVTGKEYSGSAQTKVETSEATKWISAREAEIRQFDFIPLTLYELGVEGDNVGVLTVKGKTTGNSTVNIRKEAKKNSKVVVKKKVGTAVQVINEEGDYYKVLVDGKEGYVQKDYIMVYNLNLN